MVGLRGTGRTTFQMQEAPEGAIYVWCNSETSYPTHLARKLGRLDLVVKPFYWLSDANLRGLLTPIIIDHAADLGIYEAGLIDRYRRMLRAPAGAPR